jgi:CRISPR type IV-associated protein Csf1
MTKGLPITSSVIVANGVGYEPEGVKAKEDAICAYCGLHIATGDLCAPFSPSAAFMDDISLAARGSPVACGHCSVLLSAEALRTTGYGIFSESGMMPFRKWADIANALKNPPAAPFVAVYATANNQHMAWRAPVNFSPDLFYVRVGLRDLKIRRKILLEAVDVCERVGPPFGCVATERTRAHPFQELSADLKGENHGRLRNSIFRPTKDQTPEEHAALVEKHRPDIDFLLNLTMGETWALRFLLDTGAALRAAAQNS